MVLLPVSAGLGTFTQDGKGMKAAFGASLAVDENLDLEEDLVELEEGVDQKCQATTTKSYTGSGKRDNEGEDEWYRNKE